MLHKANRTIISRRAGGG